MFKLRKHRLHDLFTLPPAKTSVWIYALGTVVSDLMAAGFAGVIIGGDGLDTPDFAELAGDAAVGVHYVTTAAPASTPMATVPKPTISS